MLTIHLHNPPPVCIFFECSIEVLPAINHKPKNKFIQNLNLVTATNPKQAISTQVSTPLLVSRAFQGDASELQKLCEELTSVAQDLEANMGRCSYRTHYGYMGLVYLPT